MSTLLSSQTARASFFALPLACRASIDQQCQHRISPITPLTRRNFSASAPRKTVYETIVSVPVGIFDAIHMTGLPWYATIPAAALIVRGFLVYKYCILPVRKTTNAIHRLSPLISAQVTGYLRNSSDNKVKALFNRANGNLGARFRQGRVISKIQSDLLRRFNYPGTLARSLANFGILVTMTEGIRQKCGAGKGLLNLPTVIWDKFQAVRSARSLDEAFYPQTASAGTQTDLELAAEIASRTLDSKYFDPALMDQGFSFCADLTSADPTGFLPFQLLMLMMLRSLYDMPPIKHKAVASKAVTPEGAVKDVDPMDVKESAPQASYLITRWGVAIAFWIFAGTELPAGIVLYLMCNTAIGTVQSQWLKYKYPDVSRITRCTRPLRIRNRR